MERQAQTSSFSTPSADVAGPVAGQAALLLPVPANLIEFMQLYGSDDACRKVLIEARWPGGFLPALPPYQGLRASRYPVIECAKCGHQASATAARSCTARAGTPQAVLAALPARGGEGRRQLQTAQAPGRRELQNGAAVEAETLRPALPREGSLIGRVEIDETLSAARRQSVGRRLSKRYVLVMVEDRGRESAAAVGGHGRREERGGNGCAKHCEGRDGAHGRASGYAASRHGRARVIGDPKRRAEVPGCSRGEPAQTRDSGNAARLDLDGLAAVALGGV